MSVCCECCTLSDLLSLQRVDHSSRGVLPSVVCLSVIEEPHSRDLGALGAVEFVGCRLLMKQKGILITCGYRV